MSSEEVLIQTRKDKHQELNGGIYPLASRSFDIAGVVQHITVMIQNNRIKTTIDLKEAFTNDTMLVHGRVSALRKSGALTFIKLTDESGSMQLVATRNNLPEYEKLRLLDLGDIIEARGEAVLTKTGEKSVLLSEWKLLTKSHRPPPEKFAGIADQELKYRKRYLDLMSNEESRARFTVRTYILRAIRDFMEHNFFMEVETSTLNTLASGANAKPFTTHHNALDVDLRLRIAPELYLKKLLVGGFERVYEIGRNYRNEGISTRHNPEFTMMESYQAYGKFSELIVFTKSLLRHIREHLRTHLPPQAFVQFEKWDADSPFSFSQFVEIPMWDAVIHAASKAELMISLLIHPLFEESPNHNQTNIWCEVLNLDNERVKKIDINGLFHAMSKCSGNGEMIATLFEYVAEPFLTEDYRSGDGKHSQPVFITQYPKAISPLARAIDKAPTLCDRFELFIEGRELANAFQELNDPDEQALRFKEQLETNNKDPMDYDADYVEALEYGMPPAIGFGMGIDRLVMLMTNTSSIKDVILFPTLKPLK